ncbi:hypothetical protein K9M79_08230 [Candidatus Woesearchaeota archaeon]|nr:hypothetical protein [Candidatus Woesearchaeota archaeon]
MKITHNAFTKRSSWIFSNICEHTVWSLIFLFMVPVVNGQSVCNLTIEDNLNNPMYVNQTYDKPFRITNNNYYSGWNDSLKVLIQYHISQNGNIQQLADLSQTTGLSDEPSYQYISKWVDNLSEYENTYENYSIISVKKYRTAGTGTILAGHAGNYSICAKASCLNNNKTTNETISNMSLKFDSEEAASCWVREFIDSKEIECNVTIRIRTDKDSYNPGDKMKIYFDINNESFPFKITYWIEDYFGRTIKKPYISENSNTKRFTIDGFYGINMYTIKANYTVGCNMTNISAIDKDILIKGTVLNQSSAYLESYDIKQKPGYVVFEGQLFVYPQSDNCKIELFSDKKIASDVFEVIPFQNVSLFFRFTVDNSKIRTSDSYIKISGCVNDSYKVRIPIPETKEIECARDELTDPISFNLDNIPEKIYSNRSFSTKLSIKGNDRRLRISNYVYRASKCYSVNCRDDYSYTEFIGDSVVQLNNRAIVAKTGTYDYRLIVENNKEVLFDFKTKIVIDEPEHKEECQHAVLNTTQKIEPTVKTQSPDAITGMTIYRSKNEKIKDLIPIGIIVVLVLVNFAIIVHY